MLLHDMMLNSSGKKELVLLATDFDSQDTNVSSYNFTMNIGTATSDRVVVVMVSAGEGIARKPIAITVNGYSLSEINSQGNVTGTNAFIAMWSGVVPAGDGNQTVAVTYGGSVRRNFIATVALSGTSVTPESNDVDRATTTAPTAVLSPVSIGSYVVSMMITKANVTFSWTSPSTYTEIGQGLLDLTTESIAMYHVPTSGSSLNVIGSRGGDSTETLITAASFKAA